MIQPISEVQAQYYHHRRRQMLAQYRKGQKMPEPKLVPAKGNDLQKGHIYRANTVLQLKKVLNKDVGTNQHNYWTPFKVYDVKPVDRYFMYKIGPVSEGTKPPKGSGWVCSGMLMNLTVREEVTEDEG